MEQCGEYIIESIRNMDAIAFSANSFNWGITRKMIEYIKCIYKDIPIIVGGLHPTYFDYHILIIILLFIKNMKIYNYILQIEYRNISCFSCDSVANVK